MAVKEQKITDKYAIYNGDCIEVMNMFPDNSIHLSLYSPPFCDLYTYSSDPRDLSNSVTYDEFLEHYDFVVKEISRITMSGRISAVHCTDIPSGNTGQDHLIDLPGDIVRVHENNNFEYIAKHIIWKEPLWVRNRTMANVLKHKTIIKDSAYCGVASSDYIVIFRKLGQNKIPIAHPTGLDYYAGEEPIPPDIQKYKNFKGDQKQNLYSHWIWQHYASSVWDDIRMTNVLPFEPEKDKDEERHMHPLQLDIIDRVLITRSNPGEKVLSPFMGVGSEIYGAVKNNRLGIGIELKPSYYKQAYRNLDTIKSTNTEQDQYTLNL